MSRDVIDYLCWELYELTPQTSTSISVKFKAVVKPFLRIDEAFEICWRFQFNMYFSNLSNHSSSAIIGRKDKASRHEQVSSTSSYAKPTGSDQPVI